MPDLERPLAVGLRFYGFTIFVPRGGPFILKPKNIMKEVTIGTVRHFLGDKNEIEYFERRRMK